MTDRNGIRLIHQNFFFFVFRAAVFTGSRVKFASHVIHLIELGIFHLINKANGW